MSVHNTDNEEQVVTRAPIDKDKPSPSTVVPVFVTIAPVDIGKPPFQTVTADLSSLSSTSRTPPIYVVPFSAEVAVFLTRAPI